ncbi:serpin family protein [Candidatus Parabeggiatoa sp. HSG14]|uniref:serpin family protein n=1 Tax=Candidatus Parabeggiatoa sp. HSG14 TaxID=3055593 RepID=UPI0025A915A1|nr:serpin family protein [Thiotrichales bacterium HSG14]
MQLKKCLICRTMIFFISFTIGHSVWADDTETDNTVMEDNTAFGLVNKVVSGNTLFALNLYAQLREKNSDNLFFSPYSLSTALAMTYVGARKNTAAQMSQVLHFPEDQNELHPAFSLLQDQVNAAQGSNIKLRIANALWGQEEYPFLSAFTDLVEKYYKAAVKNADFQKADKAALARQEINKWVEDKTNDKIKNLVKKGSITSLTRLILVNAIYFKGNWANPFDETNTVNTPFWMTPKKSVDVQMMNQKDYFGYTEDEMVQVLELPYAGNQSNAASIDDKTLSMIVILPQQRNGLAKLEKSLSVERLDEWVSRFRWQKIRVYLPKFKINTGFELSKMLASMGMPDAFNGKADFSGIDGEKELSLTSIIHQAFVDVNEKGTEAAAATAVFVGTRGMPPPTPTFRADHPFIFLIRHNSSGSILFMGKITNPIKK